jgi:hypothetical protein
VKGLGEIIIIGDFFPSPILFQNYLVQTPIVFYVQAKHIQGPHNKFYTSAVLERLY